MYKRIVLFLLLALILAVPAQRISAKSDVIPVNGVCTFIGEWQGDDFRFWAKQDWLMLHWRNNTFLLSCDFTDDRLDGYYINKDSWNTFANENKENFSQTHGYGYSSDEYGNQTEFWNISYHAEWDQQSNLTGYNSFKGKGVYQNLFADLIFTMNNGDTYITVTGDLHESGN